MASFCAARAVRAIIDFGLGLFGHLEKRTRRYRSVVVGNKDKSCINLLKRGLDLYNSWALESSIVSSIDSLVAKFTFSLQILLLYL